LDSKKYHVVYTKQSLKQLKKMDKFIARMIKDWLTKHLDDCENPRIWGKPLSANRSDQWRYRIGDYRVLSIIEDDVVTVHVIEIGHRSDIYG